MLRSIIQQLSHQAGGIPAALMDMYGRGHLHEQPTLTSLQLTLRKIVEGFERTYIIIDALDECIERSKLLTWIHETLTERSSQLHLLLSSRWEQDISDQFDDITLFQRISLSGRATSRDIESYVDAMINTVVKWTAEIRARVKQALMNGADGMFRWVAFQIAELMKCRNPHDDDVQLRALPKDLSGMYERSLSCNTHPRDLKQILIWLAFSARPLTIEELAEVVTVDFSMSNDIPAYNADLQYFSPTDILAFCTGFVTFLPTGEGIVKLAHLSVKEYLVSERIQHGAAATFSVNEALAHSTMAATCLCYLLRLGDVLLANESIHRSFPLAFYAARHCTSHVKSGHTDKLFVWQLLIRLFSPGSSALANWVRLHDPDSWVGINHSYINYTKMCEDIAPPLYYASSYGLEELVVELLNIGEDVHARGGAYGNALQAASYYGHSRISCILLEHGAKVNAVGGYGTNPLTAACLRGHIETVRFLLSHGADVNASGEDEPALQRASGCGYTEVVRLLLEHGADINALGAGETALHAAFENGHAETVKLLLERGADINALGKDGTLLHVASSGWGGRSDVVRLLLMHDANINASGEGGTSLQTAWHNGYIGIVRLLLAHDADVNASGETGPALQRASGCGYTDVVRLLLVHGADVNVSGKGKTALQAASENSHVDVIGQLLEHGAEVNASGKGGTALSYAASFYGRYGRYCRGGAMRLLLEKGAQFDGPGEGRSALQNACKYGDVTVVRLLLNSDVDLWSQGANALQIAKDRGYRDIVQLLLQWGGR
ncbi:hypothetical protein HWV62_28591 [Athelia sp. TMB]|nr:hypothetical protein HWV62_28591 [Athelia sp. TMB]